MCGGMRLQSFKRFLPLANPRSWTLRSTTDLSSDELESNRVRLTAIKPDNIATEQIVGRERRERELIADFQLPIVDLNLAVALTLTLSCFVSESRYIGIATGSKTQLESQYPIIFGARFAGSGSSGDLIPGFRSLRSLHPGLNSAAAARLVDGERPR